MESKELENSANEFKSPVDRFNKSAMIPIITTTSCNNDSIIYVNSSDKPVTSSESNTFDGRYDGLVPSSPTGIPFTFDKDCDSLSSMMNTTLDSFIRIDFSRSPCSSRLWGKSLTKHITNPTKGIRSKENSYTLSHHVLPRPLPMDWRNKIILGSSSVNRKAVLNQLGWKFRQISPDIDEKAIRCMDPLELPLLIATEKAYAVVAKLKAEGNNDEALIITADQIVLFQDKIREKPENEAMAYEYLSSLSDHHVSTISAVVCTYYPTMCQAKDIDIATVHWGHLSPNIVSKVIAKGEIYSSAGGFRIEDEDLSPHIKFIEGSVDSVFGLPVDMTVHLMNEVIRPPIEEKN